MGEIRKKKRRKLKKGNTTTLILIGMMVIGLGLIIYPSFADWWNQVYSRRMIVDYSERIENLTEEDFELYKTEAREYNAWLLQKNNRYQQSKEDYAYYASVLDVTGTGIMGYIDIPKIRVTLPIYHSVDEEVLQRSVGHMPGTSLPVGGESTHCVITGHRGLPSARLFTDIDRLTEGDIFQMKILDETLTYEVDQIRKVLPEELSDIRIEEGQDYCTLVTCTPYGVNTHRLLVRGHRIATEEELHITADAVQMNTTLIAGAIALIIIAVIIAVWLVTTRRKKTENA